MSNWRQDNGSRRLGKELRLWLTRGENYNDAHLHD